MRVKTFRGANANAVLKKVKEELGPEAVILSNRTVREDGCKVCEVMAAVERTAAPLPEEARTGDASGAPESRPPWLSEWSQIKSMLIDLAGDRLDMNDLPPRQKQAMDYLTREGVDKTVLLDLYARLKRAQDGTVLGMLGEMVRVAPNGRTNFPQKFQFFSGPHGVGKTSTVIRLALAEKRSFPEARICLVNGDGSQGKGRLVLKHYAQLSGFSYREVGSRDDAVKLVAAACDFDRVYVDLPGIAGRGRLDEWLALRGMAEMPDSCCHLLLSPHYAAAQIRDFLARFRVKKTGSIVWTKLDEACSFGEIVNVGDASDLPVSALSYGPGLRKTLSPAQSMMLWKLIFKHELPGGAPDVARLAAAS